MRFRVDIGVIFLLPCLLSAICAAQQPRSPVPIIPRPHYAQLSPGVCLITSDTRIEADTMFANAASHLARLLNIPAHRTGVDATTVIRIVRAERLMGEEGYMMSITPGQIRIEAATDAGAFYAVQSLRLMLPSCIERGSRFRVWRVPCIGISDKPRFRWRGVMLDCSRHFLPVEDVKRLIDRLAALKINRLHWHLTDDQGWRLEIRAFPELTRTGAWRHDGAMRYGGYYSQDDVRDIVAFAAERHVVIVPEIDMPGHTTAALAAYPWLGCDHKPLSVPSEWGIFTTVMCVGRESTYEFAEQVLTEVAALFPSPWIHIGGDECPRDQWDTCDSCQASLRRNALPGLYALQGLFTNRIEQICVALGKEVIGWNEVMGDASKETIVQGWYGVDVAVEAARQGYRVISSPIEPYYLNYHAGVNTLQLVYDFDPLTASNWPNNGSALLGVECCLWSESQFTPAHFDISLFPRVAAFAETAWSHRLRKDWQDFTQRLGVHGGRWTMQGQRFNALDSIHWNDGMPLTARQRSSPVPGMALITLSDAGAGIPAITRDDAARTENSATLPIVVRYDSTDILVAYGRTPRHIVSECVLTGLRLPRNPWSEVLDSTSADGLWHMDIGTEATPTCFTVSPYPNPLRSSETGARLSIDLDLEEPGAVHIRMIDARGQTVTADQLDGLFFGTQTLSLPLPRLPAGTYYLVIDNGEVAFLRKVLILP